MTPERLEEIRAEFREAERFAQRYGEFEAYDKIYRVARKLISFADEALVSRNVIHEETRRVWRFENGMYACFNWDRQQPAEATFDITAAVNIDDFDEHDDDIDKWLTNGRPVTIKITVEEVDDG